ncbi:hypothetical protein SAMN06296378_2443 [Salinibacterium xinjiangense]|uniref:Fibronectin type-III domain-containing protein n=1 Tax=Salinibacterium xinjiangense TaxID=386302 RepID=A0A2C9A0P0_9MICO|nr:hypothetical protein [Salinibacterium xinjiangense]SOE72287.1 hypothetical protein SAMN06296378_2443 [Salinibacterium xinjiangense]
MTDTVTVGRSPFEVTLNETTKTAYVIATDEGTVSIIDPVVTGLANGDSYTFTVAATNAAGTGAASTAVTPIQPPVTPRM